MRLHLNANSDDIRDAIDEFDKGYHADFFNTRRIAKEYLKDDGVKHSGELAESLMNSLINFGAGRRGAPEVKSVEQVEEFLELDKNHKCFAALSECGSRLYGSGCEFSGFRENLLYIIQATSNGILEKAANVTYPTKALMLVTGFMPALDSQVRSGLRRAGLCGFGGTRFLVPNANGDLEARKLVALPPILGKFYRQYSDTLKEGLAKSEYPHLKDEPGRLLDVMLFMQGKADNGAAPMIQCE